MMNNHKSLTEQDESTTDEYLWEKVREGNRDAYQQLYSKYLSELCRYGFKIVPNRDAVADHIQDLFIDLWKYKENLTTIQNMKYYLLRSLRNRIVKEANQNKNFVCERETNLVQTQIELPIEHIIIEEQTQLQEDRKIKSAFMTLSSRQKEVIKLLYYEKFSYEEVAGIMALNLRSTYTLAWKALSALRNELGCMIIVVLQFHLSL